MDESFRRVYGKQPEAIERDLRRFVKQGVFPVVALKTVEYGRSRPIVQNADSAATELLLAGLLASHRSSAQAAEERLLELIDTYPHLAEAEESLAYLYLREDRSAEARIHFRIYAMKRDSGSGLSSLRRRRDTCAIDLLRGPAVASDAGWCVN